MPAPAASALSDAAASSGAAASGSTASEAASEAASANGGGGGWSLRARVLVWGAVVVALGLLAWPKLRAAAGSDGGAEGSGEAAPTRVEAVVVRPTTVADRLRVTGTLRADEAVRLTSEASGKVTGIFFDEGTRVAKGALLLTVNRAELEAQRARLGHRLTLARQQAERQRALLAEGGASQETVDRAVNDVRVLEAEEALLAAQIALREVRAPFAGTIGLRQVSEGAYLEPATLIATLQRLDPIKVDFAVPERYAGRVAVGQTLTFVVRGTDAAQAARVYALDPALDPATRTLRLRARASNPGARLRPGAFADVTLTLGAVDSALVVPSFAVLPALGTQRVFVAEGGQATPRNVTLGVRTDSTVQITSGLAPGDTVLTSNIQDLRAGLPVRVRTTNAE